MKKIAEAPGGGGATKLEGGLKQFGSKFQSAHLKFFELMAEQVYWQQESWDRYYHKW